MSSGNPLEVIHFLLRLRLCLEEFSLRWPRLHIDLSSFRRNCTAVSEGDVPILVDRLADFRCRDGSDRRTEQERKDGYPQREQRAGLSRLGSDSRHVMLVSNAKALTTSWQGELSMVTAGLLQRTRSWCSFGHSSDEPFLREPMETKRIPAILLMASLTLIATIWFLASMNPVAFEQYFGALPPPFAATIVAAAGIAALLLLQKRWDFEIYDPGLPGRDRLLAAVLAIPFMAAVTLADLVLGFSDDINVALPHALLFYPAMGLIAQFALHIVPLAVLVSVGALLLKDVEKVHLVLICIVAVALLEAIFQLPSRDGGMKLLSGFVALHVFLFGVAELLIFRRYDFVSMYLFRLSYYSWWHIAWGWLRL